MRQIKFRYWDSYHKEMHYPVCPYASNLTLPSADLIREYPDNLHQIYTEALECTGVKDGNGNEIYEGDILKIITKDESLSIGDVYYDEFHAGFFVRIPGNRYLVGYYAQNCEIIGNIFENPKLLEEME